MRKLYVAFACVVSMYVLVCVLFFLFQARLVYFPSREVRLTPADRGLPFEEVRFTSADGVALHGWAIPPRAGEEAIAPWVLVCHGNGGNIAGRLDLAVTLHRQGAGVLLFDYRGYGRSEGSPDEQGLYADADAAWRLLVETRGIAPRRVIAIGESLGGGVASHLASQRQVGGLVLQSTFTSVPDVGAGLYPWLPVRWLCRHRYDTLSRIGGIACPKLVMHSPDDEMIPFRCGETLFATAPPPKEWFQLVGHHNTGPLEQGPAYAEKLGAFARAASQGTAPLSVAAP